MRDESTHRHSITLWIITVVVVAVGAAPAIADQISWTGDQSVFWHHPNNWSPQNIPAPNDTAIINREQAVLIVLSANTNPLERLLFFGDTASAVLATNSEQVIVNGLDLIGEMFVRGPFAEVQVLPSAGAPGVDADNLFVINGAGLTLINGGIVHVGQEFSLNSGATLAGNGAVVLRNEMNVPDVVGEIHGDVAAIDGILHVRALQGGRLEYFDCELSAASGDPDVLILDGEPEGTFNGLCRMLIGNDADLRFTWPLLVHGDVEFVSNGVLEGPRFDFLVGSEVSAAGGHGRIDAVATFTDAAIGVDAGAEITFEQPVAFEAGSSMQVDGTLRCNASTTYGGGMFTGTGSLNQYGELNVLQSTTISMPDGNVILGTIAGIDIDLFSGANLTISARSIGSANTIWGSTNVQESILDITTNSPMGIADEMILNSAILRGSEMLVSGAGMIHSIGFQDAVDARVHYVAPGRLVVDSSRLFVNGRTTLEGAAVISGTGTAQFDGDILVEPGSGVATITVQHMDWDGSVESAHRTIIQPGGRMQIFEVDSIESTIFDGYDGSIVIGQGGLLTVSTSDDEWKMDGVLTLDGGQVGGDHLINRGRLDGDGIVSFVPLTSTGVVAPGLPTGEISMQFSNPYVQSPFGTLEIEIGGPTAGVDYDRLRVFSGSATLAGTLHVRRVGGYEPESGQEFTVLTASSIVGAFEEVIDQAGVTVAYTPTSVVLTYVGGVNPADVDGDGLVSFSDLLAVLSVWGPCPRSAACPEDINGDGVVDFADLLAVLSNWS